MKIVQLLPELNEGGVERGVVELNREFVRAGMQSVVISKGGRLVSQIAADGGQHHTLDICSKNLLSAPLRVLRLRRLLEQLKPDIVHARSRVPAWLAWYANKPLRLPFVTTVHGMNSVNRYSQIMTRGDRVICVSEVIQEYIQHHYTVQSERLAVIQRGVDMRLFDPQNTDQGFIQSFRQQHALQDKYVVSSVGRITWLKDFETFIRSIAACAQTIPNIVGVIAGGVRQDKQDYLEQLKSLAARQGVGDKILFVGSQQKIAEIYQLSDVTVNASLKMGNVGRTVVESLAMNTPVIATTFEGLNNLVQDGLNGYVIQNQNVADLSACIQQLHQQPIIETRSTVPRAFTLEAMVQDTLSIYQSLLAQGNPGTATTD